MHSTYHKYRATREQGTLLWGHGMVEPCAFSISSGLVGTQSVLFAKCLSMMLLLSMDDHCNQFDKWFLWVAFICWLLSGQFWLRRVNTGLSLYNPLLITLWWRATGVSKWRAPSNVARALQYLTHTASSPVAALSSASSGRHQGRPAARTGASRACGACPSIRHHG